MLMYLFDDEPLAGTSEIENLDHFTPSGIFFFNPFKSHTALVGISSFKLKMDGSLSIN